jgi:ribonuclease BN (tRNA processing enzyme)
LPATIKAIKEHFLNDIIWPDFSKIKLENSTEMSVTYTEIEIAQKYKIGDDEYIKAFKTDHTVETCGYIYTKNKKSIIISADTYSIKNIIYELESNKNINSLVIECSFPSKMEELAKKSKHLTPKLLFKQLKKLKRDDIKLYINHVKPSFLKSITSEIAQNRGVFNVEMIKDGKFITF